MSQDNSQLFLCSLISGVELISPVAKRILRAKSMPITSKLTSVRQGCQTHFGSVYFVFRGFFSFHLSVVKFYLKKKKNQESKKRIYVKL